MDVTVLMSTCNKQGINDINLESKNITGPFIIVNQFAPMKKIEKFNQGVFCSYDEKGLSKSRNRLIENIEQGIGIIADDDITFVKDYQKIVKKAYLENPDADIITFNIKIGDKNIGSDKVMRHTFLSIMSVVSCQITFKSTSIKSKEIHFNELFGLGAKFTSGEENLFLKNCLDAGLNLIHVPIVICEHPNEETTGERWSPELVLSKGALSYKLLHHKHWIFFFYFLFFKRRMYHNDVSFFGFFKQYFKGVKEVKQHEKDCNISI